MQISAKSKEQKKNIEPTSFQALFRRKKIEYVTFIQGNTIEFPKVTNFVVSFPQVSKQKRDRTEKRSIQNFGQSENFSDRKRKKESFKITIENLTATKEILRRSLNSFRNLSLKEQRAKDKRDGYDRDEIKSVLGKSAELTPKQSQRFRDFKLKILSQLRDKKEQQKTKYITLYRSNPEQIKRVISKRQESKSPYMINPINLTKNLRNYRQRQRYSPWRSEDLEDELTL